MVALIPRLRRFAVALTGDLDQADDLVQESCSRALSRVAQWQEGAPSMLDRREPISDETLMRFADGDLSPDEHAVVAAECARNPEVAQRLEAFRFTKEELTGAFAPALEVPLELSAKVLRGVAPPTRASRWRPNPVAMAGFARPNLRQHVMGIAAAVTLLLAGTAGWLLRDSVRPDHAGLVAPPSLQRALEETPSDVPAKLAGDLSIKPSSTFGSLQKRWCREYTMIYSDRVRAPALACRGEDGIWRVEAQEDPASAPEPRNPNAYITAGENPQLTARQGESVAEHRARILRCGSLARGRGSPDQTAVAAQALNRGKSLHEVITLRAAKSHQSTGGRARAGETEPARWTHKRGVLHYRRSASVSLSLPSSVRSSRGLVFQRNKSP